jgi:arylformamidase
MANATKVYLDYDQEELDRAYDQAAYAPNAGQLGRRRAALSNYARERLGEPLRLAYGTTEIEKLDIYRTFVGSAPVVVFVHGGAWRGGLAANFAFPAEMFVAAGAHYVALDFINVEEAGGSLFPMIEQVRRAIEWVYRNAESFGGDRGRIHLVGHSSGAHLGGCVLTTDWEKDHGLPPDLVKSAVLCSGMYDLYPVSLSKRGQYVRFTEQMIEGLSSQRRLEHLHAPLVVANGALETPEFQRQARDFVAAVRGAGKPIEHVVGDEYNHFEILETLASPHGVLGGAALRQFGLKPA